MTADDMVSVPRELAERIYSDMAFGAAADELAAILNPPPEFDVAAIEALTAAIFSVGSWWSGHERAEKVLTAARSAGWEMVETSELEALRELVAAAWDDVNDAFIAAEMTQAQADAIDPPKPPSVVTDEMVRKYVAERWGERETWMADAHRQDLEAVERLGWLRNPDESDRLAMAEGLLRRAISEDRYRGNLWHETTSAEFLYLRSLDGEGDSDE